MIIPWSAFKNHIQTDSESFPALSSDDNFYYMFSRRGFECTINRTLQLEDCTELESLLSLFNKSPQTEVITQAEKPDKNLTLASAYGEFIDNTCELVWKIPGTVGSIGRYIAGGYGFTDHYGFEDKVTKVQLLDKDYVYAGIFYPATPLEAGVSNATEQTTWFDVFPNGVELGAYHDRDLPENQQGWRFWADDSGQGGVDIDPLGGFGKLYAGAYLVITAIKTQTSPATKLVVNLWWGEQDI